MKFFEKLGKRGMIIGASSLGAVAVTAGIVVAVCNWPDKKVPVADTDIDTEMVTEVDTEAVIQEDTEAVPEPEIITEVVEVPQFRACSVVGESIEKDLTLYVMDENRSKIGGTAFQIKLISNANAKLLGEAISAIDAIDEKISALDENPDEEQDEDVSEDVKTPQNQVTDTESEGTELPEELVPETIVMEVSSLTGEELTEQERLCIEKEKAIQEYKTLLESISGDVYTDDNSDGMIEIASIAPGTYRACLIPVNEYNPNDYVVSVNVKDKIEYVVVENIQEKTVTAEEAGDPGDEHPEAVEEEEVLTDTLSYIESSKKIQPAVYAPAKAVAPVAAVSEEMNQVFGTKSESSSEVSGSLDDKAEATEGVWVAISQMATIYSDADGADSVALNIQSGGIKQLSVTSSSTKVSAELQQDGTCRISAAGIAKDTDVTVTVTGTTAGGTGVSAKCAVKVYGNTLQLADEQEHPLFLDDKGKKTATIADYASGQDYYYVQVDEIITYFGWQNIDGTRYYFDENGNKATGVQIINGAKYTFGSDGSLLTSGVGIDVSKWQGTIDWSQVKSSVSFAIVRAGFRGSSGRIAVDPKAGQNITNASKNGIKVGLYFYSMAMTEAQAVEEASLAISVAQQYGNISLPIYIDMEDKCQESLTTEERDAIVLAFCSTVQNSGYSAGVYANSYWLTVALTPSKYSPYSIWCAQWKEECTYKGRYDIWQYSSKGSIPGISGNVDMNKSYF